MSALKANVDMPVVSASGGLLWRVSHWVQYDAGVGPPANALARPRVRLGVRNGATARLSFFEPESPALRTALARRGLKSENPFLRRTNGSCLTEMPTRRWLSLVMFEVRENLSGARREGLFLVSLPPHQDDSVDVKFVSCGRLRCSAAAAVHLRNALDVSLKMLEQPLPNPVGVSKLN